MAKGKGKTVRQDTSRGDKLFSVTLADCDLTRFSKR